MKSSIGRRDLLRIAPAPLLASSGGAASQAEIRGVWMHPERAFSADPAEGKKQVKALVDRVSRANFNLILPWITSDYLEGFRSETYAAKHPTARWDSLGMLIEEAKQRGIGVDIWYSFTDYRSPAAPEFNPEVGGNPQWAARRNDEIVPDPATGKTIAPRMDNVCAQHYAAREWMLKQILGSVARYPALRGLHIEEPGYRQRGYCLCDFCQQTFERLHGKKLIPNLDGQEAEDYRTIGTSAFVWQLRESLRQRHPQLVFSANGGHDWRRDRIIGRDWGRWARSGWFKYYASQVYVTNTDEFRKKLGMTIEDLGSDCAVYAGIAFDWSTGKNTVAEVVKQIGAARELGAPGVVLFHEASFTPEFYRALVEGPFRKPAPIA